jgi:hypothetical protein
MDKTSLIHTFLLWCFWFYACRAVVCTIALGVFKYPRSIEVSRGSENFAVILNMSIGVFVYWLSH